MFFTQINQLMARATASKSYTIISGSFESTTIYFGEILLIYTLLSHKSLVILWRKKLGNSLILML